MKKYIRFLLILFLPLIVSCNDKKDTITEGKKDSRLMMHTNDKLKDGINISTSFIKDIEFNKYKYDGQYIEQIDVSLFEDHTFRKQFFQYLMSRKFDQDQYEQVFFIKLLLVRIQQVEDIRSYYLLSLIFNDKNLGYYLEDYELDLFQVFLYKPYYFIQGEYKYKQDEIVNFINQNLPAAFLTNKKYFDINIVEIELLEKALLINKEVVDKFTIEDLKKQINKETNKIEAYFSPSFDNGWQNKTNIYYNLYYYIDDIVISKLDEKELLLYNTKYKPFFKNYIIKDKKNQYTIQDPDGYTNLRKDKNTSSEVLQKIKSGEHIEILNDSGDWYFVKTIEGEKGYVHKSRIKK
ncbi:SH3 domain-containing protein [Chryseobacterium nematophagum]|uniref:SH3 domain-containing protein n=1 Tax=Chryseobacterium nematophagum TaxID=2305228 RepID=A0A3M7LAK2_9FLAO|nr:SH3 domain-containing protein [Chryseobacterium nematophagum]RMZ59597.1 SH3 domain-containing protein [Chryseobacterium nematophagum]